MATEQLTGCAARGARVVDPHRVEYLDCGGYGVPLLGHAHPAVVQAVVGQVRRPSLLDRLMLDLVTPNGLDHIHTFPSASEAAQFAVALAQANGRPRVLTTGDVPYGGVDSLRAVLASGPPACVLVEPVRGISFPPPGHLSAIAEVCRDQGALLVVDETRSGLGRLGVWWGVDLDGVTPDILLVGEGLSGGVLPIAAVVASAEVEVPLWRGPETVSPLASAAVNACLRVTAADGLIERAAVLGDELLLGLRAAVAGKAHASGRGLLLGVELPDRRAADVFTGELLRARVLADFRGRTVSFTPPAVMTAADAGWLIEAVGRAAARI
ncbi:aminotransferase class III-fold pyridoxal phosphate-dependent enzyme [Lentzea sp. PSKA42]|uniref:Aminotransferase class III-fold pyridoxal phosphate-dependent enzyme n=1 Tax=Lentzea indica TaxID=2604800 RepID=A0ABX1FU66_9PSEU|nr:aminotransferase class III-fold pyridoxal phosphate-dependent enzyme [Lentzea indica]NKE62277.1 aminotransferase class III-fold pyridoxal phosphate-dependent enzyme [Lentzea indica]